MDIRAGDLLTMKKQHPCGSDRWLVLRSGADFKLRCTGCGHEVWLPRFKAENNVRSITRGEEPFDAPQASSAKKADGK